MTHLPTLPPASLPLRLASEVGCDRVPCLNGTDRPAAHRVAGMQRVRLSDDGVCLVRQSLTFTVQRWACETQLDCSFECKTIDGARTV
jgi:hypothetical protein